MFDFGHKNATEIQTIAPFDSQYCFDCFYLILCFLEFSASSIYIILAKKIYKNAITGCKTGKSWSAITLLCCEKFLCFII